MKAFITPQNIAFALGFILSWALFSFVIYLLVNHFYTVPDFRHESFVTKWHYFEAMLFTFGIYIVARSINHFLS